MATTVWHCRKDPYDSYIGRPSKWGNPFSHLPNTLAEFKVATLEEALAKYDEWLDTQPQLLEDLKELKGKRLGCFCRPRKGFKGKLKCHGQILAGRCDGIPSNTVSES